MRRECLGEKRGPTPIRCRGGAPRGEASRSQGASKGASQAPERLSALYSPSLAARASQAYGATGAAKQTDGGALASG